MVLIFLTLLGGYLKPVVNSGLCVQVPDEGSCCRLWHAATVRFQIYLCAHTLLRWRQMEIPILPFGIDRGAALALQYD